MQNKKSESNNFLKVQTPFLSSDVPCWIRKTKRKPKGASIPLIHKNNILKALNNICVNDEKEKIDVVCVALFPVYLLRRYCCIPNSAVKNSYGIPIKMIKRWNEERLRNEIVWSTNIYESHWKFLNWIKNKTCYDDYFIPCIGYRGWKGNPPDIQLGITGTIEFLRDNNSPLNCAIAETKEECNLVIFEEDLITSFDNECFVFYCSGDSKIKRKQEFKENINHKKKRRKICFNL